MLSNAIEAYKQTEAYAAYPIFIAEPIVSTWSRQHSYIMIRRSFTLYLICLFKVYKPSVGTLSLLTHGYLPGRKPCARS